MNKKVDQLKGLFSCLLAYFIRFSNIVFMDKLISFSFPPAIPVYIACRSDELFQGL